MFATYGGATYVFATYVFATYAFATYAFATYAFATYAFATYGSPHGPPFVMSRPWRYSQRLNYISAYFHSN